LFFFQKKKLQFVEGKDSDSRLLSLDSLRYIPSISELSSNWVWLLTGEIFGIEFLSSEIGEEDENFNFDKVRDDMKGEEDWNWEKFDGEKIELSGSSEWSEELG